MEAAVEAVVEAAVEAVGDDETAMEILQAETRIIRISKENVFVITSKISVRIYLK